MIRPLALPLAALALAASPAYPQPPLLYRVAVHPDTVTVGDSIRVVVTVRTPEGSRVTLRVPQPADGAYQALDVDVSRPENLRAHQAVATLVAWRAGPGAIASADLLVGTAGMARRQERITFRLPFVRSVLPPDSVRVQPRGPKDVLGGTVSPWLWVMAAAALLAVALLAWRLLRRRRRPAVVRVTPVSARAHALDELDRLRAAGLLKRGDFDAFYAGISAVLRGLIAVNEPRLGPDLTTFELLERMRRTGARADDLATLSSLLARADLAKFARRAPTAEGALEDWADARRWVDAFPVAPEADAREAAA
ncbi:MAG TPA: hypothetical protein VFQ45_04025 [Longimicrobium sp.]|nr:hypothetical protein [Longimicrobium sp.]